MGAAAMCSDGQFGRSATRPLLSRGFSLLDVLVTISVIAVLIAMLLPALGRVRETAHRVICSSNVRQIGLGIAMYADANNDALTPSRFVDANPADQRPQDMIWLRGGVDSTPAASQWDGLGVLYSTEYLGSQGVFYCPSHTGEHPFSAYAGAWASEEGDIASNYQYRGKGPEGSRYLHKIIPKTAAIVSDGLRTQADFNHRVGANVLRADLSVSFFWDPEGELLSTLPRLDSEVTPGPITKAWKIMDGED